MSDSVIDTGPVGPIPVSAPTDRAARERRLLEGVATLRQRAGTVIDGERLLFLLGAVFAPLGFLLILLGWYGAGDTGDVFEQIPFLISGGLGGLGLMIVGGFLYTAWWQTRRIHEARAQHQDLLERHEQLLQSNQDLLHAITTMAEQSSTRRRAPLRAKP